MGNDEGYGDTKKSLQIYSEILSLQISGRVVGPQTFIKKILADFLLENKKGKLSEK